MTEDNQEEKRPKLKLSRTPKDETPEADKPKDAATEESTTEESPEPKRSLKLNPSSSEAKEESSEEASPKPTPPPPAAPEAPPPSPKIEQPDPKPEASSEDSANPEQPIDKTAHAPAAEKPRSAPPPPPPQVEDAPPPMSGEATTPQVEQTVSRVEQDEPNKSKGIFTSLIIMILLLGILGGSGYGIYYVLLKPDSTASSDSPAETSDTEVNESSGGPISKTKEVISSVTAPETVDAITDTAAEPEEPAPTAPTAPTAEAAPTAPQETAAAPQNTSITVDPAQANAVSEFLNNAHIGGIRTGDRPKLILDGRSYTPNDLVDLDTGLRFIGFRDDKLAFKDDQGIVYLKSF